MKKSLVGKTIKVVEAKNMSLNGIEGKVIDETKNTIKIIDKKGNEKMLVKKQVTLEIDGLVIDGEKLSKKIEERIKR